MHHALTVGDIVWTSAAVVGIIVILAVLGFILTAIGNAFKD
jgi:hypothetical protein